ncbi:MAG: hypothetical protein VX005_07135 [Pseudomonadota bacterium]|nr:hypothetical protein [Pseudomonadota bacterium]
MNASLREAAIALAARPTDRREMMALLSALEDQSPTVWTLTMSGMSLVSPLVSEYLQTLRRQ